MSTFKKGDRLKVVRGSYYGSLLTGDIVTATADAFGGWVDIRRSNGARGRWNVDRFEKVETFKKGDRIRKATDSHTITGNPGAFDYKDREAKKGDAGEVINAAVVDGSLRVRWERTGRVSVIHPKHLERITEYTVGQKVTGDDYDMLPVGSQVRMDGLSGLSGPLWVKEASGWAFDGGKAEGLRPGDRRAVRVVVRVGPAPVESYALMDGDGDWWVSEDGGETFCLRLSGGDLDRIDPRTVDNIRAMYGIKDDGKTNPLPTFRKGDRVRIIGNTDADDPHNLTLNTVGVIEGDRTDADGRYDVRGLHKNGRHMLSQWVRPEDLRKTYAALSKPETPRVTWQDPAPRTRALGFAPLTAPIFDEAPPTLSLAAQVRDLEAKVKRLEGDLERERETLKHWRTVASERGERIAAARRALSRQ